MLTEKNIQDAIALGQGNAKRILQSRTAARQQ
jgi:hypothetical protein